tara:strand:+ start:271 stop:492 length:222 start_codon:yes stop_codon:yes gene_type:complete
MLSMFKDSKETFEEIAENVTEKKKEIEKQIGGIDKTTFWGIIAIIIIILILLPLGLIYIVAPQTLELDTKIKR